MLVSRVLRASLLVLLAIVSLVPPARAEDPLFEYFSETGHNVRGEFLAYFNAVGGLQTLGLPRTEDFREGDRLVQYFQNARLEYDCGSDGRQPCRLRPGTLGEIVFGKKLDLTRDQEQGGIRYSDAWQFPQSNTVVAAPFLTTFEALGGVAFFGVPLTDATIEGGQAVQWFQRGKLVVGGDGAVRLAPLGDYYIDTLKRLPPVYLIRRPAPAPLPPVNIRARQPQGRLVFQTAFGGNIVLVNADGTGSRIVTSGAEPAISPDGSRLAFVRWSDPQGLYVLNLLTGEEKRLSDVAHPRAPIWSPDGTRIAILRAKIDPVLKINPTTRRPEYVDEEHFNLAIVDAGSGTIQDVPSKTFSASPSWSPDGDRLVFDGNDGLYIANARELGEPVKIAPTNNQFTQPAWSPDGGLIAFALRRNDHYDIAVISPNGGGTRLVTDFPPFTRASNNVAPAWSPDGSQIVFLSDRDGTWQLYTIDVDGKNLRPVFTGDRPFEFDYSDERVVNWSR